MISVHTHRAAVLADVAAVEPLEMLVAESLGCVVAEDVLAQRPIPSFPVAAFEGIAVRSADVSGATHNPVSLTWATSEVSPGTAIPIHAGEALPLGADSVLPLGSWRDLSGMFAAAAASVQVEAEALPGFGVWQAGHDCEIGESVLPAGTVVGPGAIAVLVAAGVSRVAVIPKPRCVVFAVSDAPTTDPVLGMLTAVVTAAGGQAYPVGPVPADDSLRDILEDQLVRADLIVICGDWAGAEDRVRSAIAELAVDNSITEVELALEPTGRTWLAHIGSVPVLVVPADPWAAYVSFEAFVLPLLRRLRGEAQEQRDPVVAECTADVAAVSDRQRYILARLSREGDENRAQPLHPSRAGLLTMANGVIVVEPQMELRAGRPCSVYTLPGEL